MTTTEAVKTTKNPTPAPKNVKAKAKGPFIANPAPKNVKTKEAKADDWEDVLVVAGTEISDHLAPGEVWLGVYLGFVAQKSKFGPIKMHLVQTEGGLQARWGGRAIDEGLGRVTLGRKVKVTGKAPIETPMGLMRVVRVQQSGPVDESVAVIRDSEAEADAVYATLGLDPETARRLVEQHAQTESVFTGNAAL